MSSTFLDNINWRFATKQFDPDKKLSEEVLNKVIEATRFAPSSFGLQPYHVYVVGDDSFKAKLKEAGYGQPQFIDASHVFVFCARTDVNARIEGMIEGMTHGSEEAKEGMKEYIGMMRGFAEGLSAERAVSWAGKQAYIALGFALAACAELKIDACPMEGFSTEEFDKILEVPANFKSAVVMTVGYRKEGPKYPKFRYSKEDLFTVK